MTSLAVPEGVVLLAIVVTGVVFVECLPTSRQLARAMVRWAAYQKYADNAERAETRAREWEYGLDCDRSNMRRLSRAVAFAAPEIWAVLRSRRESEADKRCASAPATTVEQSAIGDGSAIPSVDELIVQVPRARVEQAMQRKRREQALEAALRHIEFRYGETRRG